jgi:chemotaxis signal transduction protein
MVFATVAVVRPGDRDDVARLGLSTGTRSSPRNAMILTRGRLDHLAVAIERVDRLIDLDRARLHPAGQDAAEEVVAVKQRRRGIEGRVLVHLVRWRHVIDDLLEQRRQRAFARLGSSLA